MKSVIYFFAILLALASFSVNAEKPSWAGEKTQPSAEDRSSHKDDMTSKNDEKSKKGKDKKSKDKKDEEDDEDNKKDKKSKDKGNKGKK
jgi:hypothetical protein